MLDIWYHDIIIRIKEKNIFFLQLILASYPTYKYKISLIHIF